MKTKIIMKPQMKLARKLNLGACQNKSLATLTQLGGENRFSVLSNKNRFLNEKKPAKNVSPFAFGRS